MALATYSDLKSTVVDFLDRTDLTSTVPTFILLCEAKMRRALRGATVHADLDVSAAENALPSDFQEAVALYHGGPTYYFPVELLSPGDLSAQQQKYPDAGVPRYGAIVNRLLRLIPVPQETFTLGLDYYADLESLSDTTTSNWVLQEHPDLYLTGTLAEAEPYLKNDARVGLWREQFEAGLEQVRLKYERQSYGANSPALRPRRAIG